MNEHKARRRFGQNFLVDTQVVQRILAAIAAGVDDHVVEIGPGQGALTAGLAASAGRLTLIELDRDLGARLQEQYAHHPNVHLIVNDALRVDLNEVALDQPIRVVGNLPYNVSTPLMFHFFRYASVIHDMTFMLQREVALRLLAQPGDDDYGRLSVMTQFHCHGDLLLHVPPGAFRPIPKVQSAVVRLVPHPPPLSTTTAQEMFARLVREAFSQRRKTLRNSLRNSLNEEQIRAAGIDPGQRAETLAVADFVRLTETALQ